MRSAPPETRPVEPIGTMTAPDRVMGTVRVVAVGRRQATIDRDPVFAVDLLVSRPGTAPESLATSLRVPLVAADSFVAGTEVPVELSSLDPSVFDIDWARLGAGSAPRSRPGRPAGPPGNK